MLTEYYFAVRYGDIIILLYHEDMMSVRELLFKNSQEVQKIDISGGEPLLYKLLPFLVCKCREYGFYVTITTRGIGIPEKDRFLSDLKKWFVNIAIYQLNIYLKSIANF